MCTTAPENSQISPPYLRVKHALDILFALLLFIILAPWLLLMALMICADSAGPAIYCQPRIGKDGRLFTILKFRTMKQDTPVLSTEEMQRQGINPHTRFGALLRKTSLDELPQLLNILKGEMSFIGPRPALPSQVDVNTLRETMGVHALRPGITGLAQVMGRDDLDTPTKVRYDAEYRRKVSLGYDAWIIQRTIQAVLSARGNK